MFRRKGQSTLEYVLILTAIIAAVIVAANAYIKPRLEGSLDHVSKEMKEEVDLINFGSDKE